MMDIKNIENFLSKKEDISNSPMLLSKWEKEIKYLLDKKIKQKIIIEFLFENDEEIKNKYQNKYSNFQSMVSQFCSRLKKSKRRNKPNENNIVVNSSTSCEVEEQNKDSDILSKIEDKKQEKRSFLPSDYVDGKDVLNKILKYMSKE